MRIERRRLAAVLMTAGVLLLGHAAELAAQTRVPWWRRIILPNPRIDATSSYTQHKVPFSTDLYHVMGLTNAWFAIAFGYADFNGDGQLDTAMVPVGFSYEPREPRIISLGSPIEDITDQVVDGPLPSVPYGQRVLVADFNRDGRPDVYLTSAYYPAPGTNALLLSQPSGKLRWIEALSALEGKGFHQAASAADVDNDGDVDIFVADDIYLSGRHAYFLLNDGRGNFTVDTTRVPPDLGQRALSAAELIDVDRDGYLDLILGSNEPEPSEPNGWATRVYWGGPFGFARASSTLLPGVPDFGVVVDVEADDLDGDGRKDLVVTRVRSDPATYFQGYYFQVLRQARRRTFADESLDRIIGDPATWPGALETGSPITRIRLADIDGDGSRDIVVDNKALGLGWVNDGRGYFTFRSPW